MIIAMLQVTEAVVTDLQNSNRVSHSEREPKHPEIVSKEVEVTWKALLKRSC
jgi:hypothetical protein